MLSNSMPLLSIDSSFDRIIFCRCHCSDTTATRSVAAARRTPNMPTRTSGFTSRVNDVVSTSFLISVEVELEYISS